jgi:hypothetical protein
MVLYDSRPITVAFAGYASGLEAQSSRAPVYIMGLLRRDTLNSGY